MLVNKAQSIGEEVDVGAMKSALAGFPRIEEVVILAELADGRTQAKVLLVDIVVTEKDEEEAAVMTPSGQFILKMDEPANLWPGEPSEAERHRQAAGWDKTGLFAEKHIPKLRHSWEDEYKSVLLYDIAGLSQLRLANYEHLGAGVHADCCGLVSTSLLTELNAEYTVETGKSGYDSVSEWLTYRLNPDEAKRLHDLASELTHSESAFTISGHVYINPLWLASCEALKTDRTRTRFVGLQHGDLHGGNLFFDKADPMGGFWTIDWALSRECPLFYDQAYLELSLIIKELSGTQPGRLASLIEISNSESSKTSGIFVPQELMALASTMTALQNSRRNWQKLHEANRADSILYQWLLARAAVGLNWANKPLEKPDRMTAFLYASIAATQFLELFYSDVYQQEIQKADSANLGTVANKYKGPDDVSVEDWGSIWNAMGAFDETQYSYMLVAGRIAGLPAAAALGFLPWSAILDFDPESEVDGLHAFFSENLGKRRSLSWFGMEKLPVNYLRGTGWMMVNGWPSRNEDIPPGLEDWRRSYLRRIRELSREVRSGTTPRTMKVLILPGDSMMEEMIERTVEAVDEVFSGGAEFILFDRDFIKIPAHELITNHFTISGPDFLWKLERLFGTEESVSVPQLPGRSGPVNVSADTLRNWEEDFDVVHSSVLETPGPDDAEAASFFRGMPPSWRDLSANLDVGRTIGSEIEAEIRGCLDSIRSSTTEFWHSPGAGATTVALRICWNLRKKYPVLVLRRYSRLTADRLDAVYQKCQKTVLLVADAADLPTTARVELLQELVHRNARIGLLYLVRAPRKNDRTKFALFDPMTDSEDVRQFCETYLPRCKNEFRRGKLRQISDLNNSKFDNYRSPFFFGLTTYEEDFLSLDRYVSSHLQDVPPLPRQALLYLALSTLYSQKGLSEAFFRRLFQPPISGELKVEQILGIGPARLVVHGNSRVKLVHPLIAEEVLREMLGGSGESAWKNNLKDLCIQLVREVVAIIGSDSDEAKELLTQLFIYRDPWSDNKGFGRRHFSPLIEAIPTVEAQQQVLIFLTEVCEDEPHYWNHLGRHLIYKTNENFEKAEEFLKKAVDLSEEQDALHFHALGMVRRFWAKNILDSLFNNAHSESAELSPSMILDAVGNLTHSALYTFERARELNPEDEHGYVTPIQTVLMVTEAMCRASKHSSITDLCARNDAVGEWVQKYISEAEDLLSRLKHFRGQKTQSNHERTCQVKLTELYGDFDELIATWESVLTGSADQMWLRKAVARAYFARRGRKWGQLSSDELHSVINLCERNLSFDPTSEADLRTWFQAYRHLPEFSYNEALNRLQAWASRTDSVDAHYYLYILHFLRWVSGGERDEELIQKHLRKSSELSIGRRDNSYEWYATGPEWCPLVNSRELGGWKDQKSFFRDTGKLAYLEGTISSLKRTSGTIRIGHVTRAFFRPPPEIRESEHMNARVHFFLGFSYERLHAWVVKLGPAPSALPSPSDGSSAKAGALQELSATTQAELSSSGSASSTASAREPKPYRSADPSVQDKKTSARVLSEEALRFTQWLIGDNNRKGKQLILSSLGNSLREEFPGEVPVHKRIGYPTLRKLVLSWGKFSIEGSQPPLFIKAIDRSSE